MMCLIFLLSLCCLVFVMCLSIGLFWRFVSWLYAWLCFAWSLSRASWWCFMVWVILSRVICSVMSLLSHILFVCRRCIVVWMRMCAGCACSCCSFLRFSALMKSCTICREFSLCCARFCSLRFCCIFSWLYTAKVRSPENRSVTSQSCMVIVLLSHILFGFSTQNTRWVAGMVFLLRISRFVALCLRSCCCTHFY